MGYHKQFHPSNVTRKELNNLADQIENFLEILEEVMVIPENLKSSEKQLDVAMKMVRKLIKKLRAGDTKVFKDFE